MWVVLIHCDVSFLFYPHRNHRAGVSDTGYGRGAKWCPQLHRGESPRDAPERPENRASQHTATTDHCQPRSRQTGERRVHYSQPTLTRNPNRPRDIVHTFIFSPHTKHDQDTQVKISKQTLNQLHSFVDRSKSIKHSWQFSELACTC